MQSDVLRGITLIAMRAKRRRRRTDAEKREELRKTALSEPEKLLPLSVKIPARVKLKLFETEKNVSETVSDWIEEKIRGALEVARPTSGSRQQVRKAVGSDRIAKGG